MIGDPTEIALLIFAHKIGITKAKIDSESPIDSKKYHLFRKKMTTTMHGVITVSLKPSPKVLARSC